MRKDAQVRRERLIAAAAELFEQHGYGVALELVADRAKIGRGTLYRNFADRNALIVAVLETRLEELARFMETNLASPTLFEDFVRQQGIAVAFHAKALVGTDAQALEETFRSLRERADTLLQQVIERAVAAGSIAPDISLTDMRIINRMLIAAATVSGIDRDTAVERALRMLMPGLSIRGG